MALLLCLCLAAMACSGSLTEDAVGRGVALEYESALFDTGAPISVNILMDETQWASMLANAMQETYYQCDVEINGQTFYRVGIRPKGNTSLSSIANDPDTDRFSLKLEFGQYVDGQTCYGLDKLVLNNNYADATNMKEALIYDMFRFLGADASLYNYAKLSVNGEYWGVYLALEAVEDSFLLRNYGVQAGALYKPEGTQAAGGGGIGQGGMGLPREGGDAGGADLRYTDDALDSYAAIWDGAVTDTGSAEHRRVVTALQHSAAGTELETYLDVDNLLRYMAVHVFSVNQDSLSGNMAHNYYLYESEGQLNLLPWDYNLAFGGMNGNDAAGVVNDAIDTPWDGTDFFDALLEDGTYLARYHSYLRQLADTYVEGGGFDAFYTRTRSLLDPLVERDPTAFYSFSDYTAAAEMLYKTVKLRSQSVAGQLDGAIPATDDGQRADSSALVDASSLELSVMGGMESGGGRERGASSPAAPQELPAFSPSARRRRFPAGRTGGRGFPAGRCPERRANGGRAPSPARIWRLLCPSVCGAIFCRALPLEGAKKIISLPALPGHSHPPRGWLFLFPSVAV